MTLEAGSSFRPVQAVLFVCNYNMVRSPMAEALLKLRYGARIYAQSCGVEPGQDIDGFAIAAIAELKGSLHGHKVRGFADLEEGGFDLVVALTETARDAAKDYFAGEATDIEYWPTGDATIATGSREDKLNAYRDVRDQLDKTITQRFAAV